jgi:LuxR family transcriptional regulator, maltose regulon positive regulatory protein
LSVFSRPVQEFLNPPRLSSASRFEIIIMKLIASKITIPTETPLVCRQGLLDMLRENLESCHATIIDGRAGTGKTMLAVDFVRRYMQLAAWYKVAAPDMSLPVFIEYLVASVATVRPGFGRQTLQSLAQSHETGRAEVGGEFDVAGLAEAFVYDLERQAEPLVLVIDDLHLIYGADWVTPFFYRLLLLLPAEIHMLIVGRGLPPAPMWRLRSKQRLLVIDEHMLAFTQTEAEELFSGYGLGSEEASLALERTGGRAVCLHAAAIRASLDLKAQASL